MAVEQLKEESGKGKKRNAEEEEPTGRPSGEPKGRPSSEPKDDGGEPDKKGHAPSLFDRAGVATSAPTARRTWTYKTRKILQERDTAVK